MKKKLKLLNKSAQDSNSYITAQTVHLAKFSIQGLLWILATLAVAVMLVAGAGVYVLLTEHFAQRHEQQINADADAIERELSNYFTRFHLRIEILANDPVAEQALENVNSDALHQREAEIAVLFPDAMRVMLLPADIVRTARPADFPELGFADIDLFDTLSRDITPPLESHLFGTDFSHIDFVNRIQSRSNRSLLGFLLVSFKGSFLDEAMKEMAQYGDGYFELQQVISKGKPLVLAKQGDAVLSENSSPLVRDIKGTAWRLQYFAPAPESLGFELNPRNYAMIFLGAALALLILVVVFARLIASSVRKDLSSIVSLVRDMVAGRILRQVSDIRLRNFTSTYDVIGRIDVDVTPTPVKVNESVDDDEYEQAEIHSSGFETIDLIFQDNKAMSVENIEVVPKLQKTQQVPAGIFKAYDIRGIVGKTLTPELVTDIGRALGSEAFSRGQQTVAVARDGRLSGPELLDALIKGLTESGRDVINLGLVPTPVLYFGTNYLNTTSGVMLTGSHNPPDYNGLKMVLKGETLSGDTIQALRKRIEDGDYQSGIGSVEEIDIVADYIERIVGDVELSRPLKVVVDCGNGAAGDLAPRLLRSLGCEVIELFCEIDGNFPNHHPDPSQPENLSDVIEAVMTHDADLGLAFDGDGDRLGVIDSRGNVIWPDRQMVLYAKDVISRNPGAEIIYDVKCSRHLGPAIKSFGGKPVMWKTGHSLIKARMKETGALLAGEMSGHIFFKERWYGFDDALYTAARLLEIVAADLRSSYELFAEIPNAVSTPELKLDMDDAIHASFMQRLIAAADFPDANIITIDGLRVEFEDGWGLVRASNTTPCLVIRFEADNPSALKRVQGEFRQLMLGLDSALILPF
ncbi:MAG: phosphoglucomutase [Gammaproteobacteria bacterium]|nr:MAG: phosphoglucomutase [Gammaproteobacteria bacterium]